MEPSLGTRKAVFEGLVEVSGPIGKKIRSGRPIAVAVGTLAGALLGGGVGYLIAPMFAVAVAIVSALVGAVVSAICFPQPPDTSRPAGWFGAVLHNWEFAVAEMRSHVTLTEFGFFFGHSTSAWPAALAAMADGVEPDSDLGQWIALDDVRYFERREASPDVTIGFDRSGALKRFELTLGTVPDCDEFVALVQQQIGRPFVASDTQMPVGRATLVPLVILGVALAIVGGIAAVAQHWRVSPPTPPIGNNGKPDELVAALTWAGPLGVAAVGSIAVFAALGWVILRYLSPPKIRVLQIADADPE
jgi:hypothetical protein